MRLYTIGYGNQGFQPLMERLDKALRKANAVRFIVFDVRARPKSWCRDLCANRIDKNFAMEGYDYRWCPCLGNEGTAENMHLADERLGLAELRLALRNLHIGEEVVLLCAEYDHQRCHRSYIADKAGEMWGVEVIHL